MKTFIDELSGVEVVIIDRGNGEFISMPKSLWNELNVDSESNK